MTIANYSDLKTALENFSLRPSDTVISNRADEFIDLCEAVMLRGLDTPFDIPPLRCRQMITRNTSYSIDDEYVALPSDWLEHYDLYLDTPPRRPVDYVAPQVFDRLHASTVTQSYPKMFTVIGSNARFAPAPAATVTGILSYYAEFGALSDANTTNFIITDAPHVYLTGCLMWLYWLIDQDESRATTQATIFSAGIRSLNEQEQRSAQGATMVARTLTGTP